MSNQKVTTINDAWNQYRERVIPEQAPEMQVRECKRVFFAGFRTCLHLLNMEVAPLPDGDAERAMESLYKQCEGFYEAVKMGEA